LEAVSINNQDFKMNIQIRQVTAAAAVVVASLASAQAMAAKWTVTDIGTLDDQSFMHINNKGQVVGSYINDAKVQKGFVTDANGANRRDALPYTQQYKTIGINDDGVTLSVLQGPDGKFSYLANTPSNPPQYSFFFDASYVTSYGAISNSGLITGTASTGPFEINLSGGLPTALRDQGGTRAINKSGQVLMSGGFPGPFLTGPGGTGGAAIVLPSGVMFMSAVALNDAGQAVGEIRFNDNKSRAFITGPNGQGVTEIGSAGGVGSDAFGINRFGHTVGLIYPQPNSGGFHAFITSANGKNVRDLTKEVTLPTGYLTHAYDINDKGQVAAFDYYNRKAYLLTPAPTCAVTYAVTSATSSKFTAKVTVSNLTASAISGWSVNWTYGGSSTLSKVSGAKVVVAGNGVTATPTDFNGTIKANASTSFTFTGTNGIAAPTVNDLNALVGGEICSVSVK
jgi:uncharacterized protein YuzE